MLAACFVVGMLVYGTRFSFGVFFKALEDEFGWARATTSGIFSAYMVLAATVPVVSGWLCDKYGPRLVISLSGFFVGLSLVLTSRAEVLWQFYLTYSLLLAFGTGGVYAVMMSTVSRWFTTKRGLVIGIAGTGGGVGTLIMSPVAAQLISSYGWRDSALILGIAAWVIIIFGAMLMKRGPTEIDVTRGSDKVSAEERAKIQPPNTGLSAISLRDALGTKDFWLLFATWFIYAISSYLVTTHLVPYGIDSGLSALSAATLLSLLGGVSVLGRVAMGRAADMVGSKKTLLVGAFIHTVALLSVAYVTGIWILFLFAVVYGFVRGGIDACVGAIAPERFGLRHIGTIMGALSIGYDFGAGAGPLLGGFIFDVTNSYKVAFLAAGGISLIMAVAIALLGASAKMRTKE